VRSALVVSNHNGTDRTAFEAPFAPFYMFWNPDGSQLAYLSSWVSRNQPSLALRLLTLEGAEEPIVTLAEGQPLYFSWSPDGTKMLTHIGNDRIELQSLDGSRESLVATGAQFPAPQWSRTGTAWIYADDVNGRQRLVAAHPDEGSENELTDFDGRISFTLSPNGHDLAYLVTPKAAPTPALGPLYVVDVATGQTREISDRPVIAFFWSPDGEKLAFLAAERSENSIGVRWKVWTDSGVQDYGLIVPSRTFLQSYLAFFDQYAQSMSIWSPDSSAFAYAGADEENRRGIWVQELGQGTAPQRISRGVFVAWSPQ
jgi:TolB protein